LLSVNTYSLDGVGNDVSGLERVAHTGGSHGDTVTDTDGVEAVADKSGLLDTLLDLCSQIIQVHVAGVSFVPAAHPSHVRRKKVVFVFTIQKKKSKMTK
jgi:hypothetical protein